jgi:hypothetical protein
MGPSRVICSAIAAAALARAASSPLQPAFPAPPLAFWALQEDTGAPRVSAGSLGSVALVDGNASAPILRSQHGDGLFGPFAALFPGTGANNSMRLKADRADAPGLTVALAGPAAPVTLMAWIRRTPAQAAAGEGMVAGVWDEFARARQYAIFTDLGACRTAVAYDGGLAAHISNCGGPTPGQRFCITRACDPRPLPSDAWHCLATVYDGASILAYVNGTAQVNANATQSDNPFAYPGGIYSPEAAGKPGAEFGVGANYVNHTVGGPPVLDNVFTGLLGGLAVWAQPLSAQDVAAACAAAPGFSAGGRSGA